MYMLITPENCLGMEVGTKEFKNEMLPDWIFSVFLRILSFLKIICVLDL